MSKNQAFNRLWSANIFSNLADGFEKAAIPILAVTLTKDPVLVSLISALVMLPWLLLAVPIGTLIDGVNKKNALALSNSLRVAITAFIALAIAADFMSISILIVISFIVGICEVIADTASATVVQTVVNNKDLEKANSKFEMTYTVIQDFIGAPLGGLLYGIAIAIPFIASSAGYALAAVLCFMIPIPFIKPDRHHDVGKFEAFKSDLKTGMQFWWNHAELKRLVLFTTAVAFAFSLSNSTVILYLTETLGLNPKNFGFFLTITGIASLLGAAIAPTTAKVLGRGRTMALGIVLSTTTILVGGMAPNYLVFVLVSCASTFTILHWNILLMATYQRLIPQELYARVHSARRTLIWGCMPIASFVGGFIAKINLRLPFIIGGCAALAIALLNARFVIRLGNDAVGEKA